MVKVLKKEEAEILRKKIKEAAKRRWEEIKDSDIEVFEIKDKYGHFC